MWGQVTGRSGEHDRVAATARDVTPSRKRRNTLACPFLLPLVAPIGWSQKEDSEPESLGHLSVGSASVTGSRAQEREGRN